MKRVKIIDIKTNEEIVVFQYEWDISPELMSMYMMQAWLAMNDINKIMRLILSTYESKDKKQEMLDSFLSDYKIIVDDKLEKAKTIADLFS